MFLFYFGKPPINIECLVFTAAGSEQDLTAEHEDQPSAKVQDSCGEEENKTEEVTANESTELKKESASSDSEASVVEDKTEDKDQQETEENKQSVADDIPDGSELTDEDRQDVSVSVAESDRESLLDKVDLFDTDTKEEEELREVQRNILEDQTTKVDIDSLDHNGNEATEEKEGVDFDEIVPNGDTVEKFVEASPEINTQVSGLDSQNEGSSVDDCKEVNEFFLTETVTKVSEEDQKEDSASDSGEQEDEGCRRQVNETEEKQTKVEDLQTIDAKSFTLDSLERDSNIVEEGTYTIRSDVSETLTNVTASLEDIEMPEKQDPETLSPSPRGDGVLSPSLQRANFRYRWAKTVRTESNYVVFFSTYKMEEPIKLTWSEACECYYSQEYDIPTGVYRGNLVIDGQTYPVEDLTIKHYTFEADLYVKEDLAEDEAIPKQTTDATISVDVDTQGSSVDPPERFGANLRDSVDIGDVDGGIHKSSKYEELVKKQLSQSNSLESDMNRSNLDKPEYEISGRRSPIGDVATEPFQDGGDSMMYRESLGDRPLSRGSLGERPMSKGDLNISVVEDEVERPSSVHSNRFSGQGSGRQTPGSVGRITPQISNDVDEFFTSERREPVRSSHSSARQTPQQADLFCRLVGCLLIL
ncbi:hypothetical protein FSP39_008732 [Pinctada imbricata]|uniref:Uncharacterized protein n=1 Tax=Pinctada imbricata TaxID=66713 RepID=A0AA88Y888_PINIB|nr:hypothetical protein FSP39_008732 [Pinctada imbricata]